MTNEKMNLASDPYINLRKGLLSFLFLAINLYILINVVLGGNVSLGLIVLPLVLGLSSIIIVKRPDIWIVISIIAMPFVFYLRQFFPGTVSLGGVPFVLTGVVKELLAISTLILTLPYIYKNLSFKYLTVPLLVYVCIVIIGAIRCSSTVEAISFARVYCVSIVYYLIAPYVFKKSRFFIKYLAISLILFAILDATVGLYRYFVDPNFLYVAPDVMPFSSLLAYEGNTFRLNGILQVNFTAVMMAIGIYATLLYGRKTFLIKNFWIVLVSVFAFDLLLTQSRTGFLSLLLGLSLWAFAEQVSGKKFVAIGFVFLVLSGCGYLILNYIQGGLQIDILTRTLDFKLDPRIGRGYYWAYLLSILSPLDYIFGKGLNVFGGMGLSLSKNSIQSTADNFLLQLLVTTGLLGATPFVLFIVNIISRALKSLKRINSLSRQNFVRDNREMMFAFGLVVILFVASIAGVSIQDAFFGALFWLCSGYVSSVYLFQK